MHVCRHGLQTTVLHNLVSTFGDHDTHEPCRRSFLRSLKDQRIVHRSLSARPTLARGINVLHTTMNKCGALLRPLNPSPL